MPDRKIAIAGAPNLIGATELSTLGGPYPAGMPPTNLQTDEPSQKLRLTSLAPWLTNISATFISTEIVTPAATVACFGLVNLPQLSRWGKYRIASHAYGDPSGILREQLAPNAQLAATNATGGVTNVDEDPASPDGLWVTPTSTASSWNVRYSFPTPVNAPASGTDRQAFVLWVRLNGSAPEDASLPLVQVEVWESGALLLDLGTRAVTLTTGHFVIFRWDAALLGAADGSNVEIKIICRGIAEAYIELGAVAWDSEYGSFDHDSGWLSSPFGGSSASWGSTAAGEPAPMQNLLYQPTTPWTEVHEFIWMFSDDQCHADGFAIIGFVGQAVQRPVGYLEIGCSVAGPIFTPSVLNFSRGPLLSAREASISGTTLGGQEYGSRRRPRRVLPVRLAQLTEGEGYSLFDRLDWRKGRKLPVLVVKFPDGSDDALRLTSLWATLEDMPGLEIPPAHGRLAWSGLFIEKL